MCGWWAECLSPRPPGPRRLAAGLPGPAFLVIDALEVEPPRRGRRSRVRAEALAGQEVCEPFGWELEHRPDQRPDHVPQEAVGGDLELEHVVSVDPAGLRNLALEDSVVGLARRERAEVVSAGEERGRLVQLGSVDRSRIPPRPP